MAAIFTPGLTVTPNHIVLKDRRLPLKGEVAVKVGDVVTADQVVARTDLPGKVFPVNAANQLGVDAARLKQFMLKDVGASVEAGEIVARTPGIMGFFKSEVEAVVSGTIESISSVTGMVIYQAHPIPVEVEAYVNGKVVEVYEDEGCVVQTAAALVQGIFGLGGEVRGDIAVAVDSATTILEPKHLKAEHAGKVVVGGAYASLDALRKAVEVKAAALVVGGFDYDDIKDLLGYEVGVAITGGEELGTTLVVTEGFGHIDMAPATFALLKSLEGRRASVNGATQIRAGVIRPEVVVTHDDRDVPAERWEEPEPQGIAIGDLVRGIRAPWFGRIGRVKSLPVEPLELPSGTTVRVLEIAFEGETANLPRANVESIDA
jgi:hypothetical protein